MNQTVENIIRQCNSKTRIDLVKKIDNSEDLFSLIENYNWDDGFELPFVVVSHDKCDLGLALMLFWEFDEPKFYYENPKSKWLFSDYEDEKEIEFKINFCNILIEGIKNNQFKKGPNAFDTGFFGEDLYPENDRKSKIRKMKTKRALEEYEEAFLKPCLIEN